MSEHKLPAVLEGRLDRDAKIGYAAGVFVEIGLCWAIAAILDIGDGNTAKGTFYVWCAFFALSAVVWLKTRLIDFVCHKAGFRSSIARAVNVDLECSNFPKDRYTTNTESWFVDLASDESLSPEIRVKAATYCGMIAKGKQLGVIRTVQYESALGEGIARFHQK